MVLKSAFFFPALEYHNLDTSVATKIYWVTTGKLVYVINEFIDFFAFASALPRPPFQSPLFPPVYLNPNYP